MSPNPDRSYVPPLRFAWLTPLFDATVQATTREALWRPRLVAQAQIQPGHRVVELGCGTGTLTVLIKTGFPGAQVVGLDADERALAIARSKAKRLELEIEFQHGLIDEASFDARSFDRVVSSLVFHHLAPDGKRRALARARQWLRPGGELHIADWGRAGSLWMRAAFVGVQLLDGFANTRDQVRSGLEPFMAAAGFTEVRETHRVPTPLGVVSLYRAVAP